MKELFEQMASAAEQDAGEFWPNAPLYAMERAAAAEVWKELAELEAVTPEGLEWMASGHSRAAQTAWETEDFTVAASLAVKASTLRRAAKIIEKHQ